MSQYIPTETNVKSNSCCVAEEKHILEDWEEEDIFSQAMAQLDILVETQRKIIHKIDQKCKEARKKCKEAQEKCEEAQDRFQIAQEALYNYQKTQEDIENSLSKGEEGLKNLLEMLECARRKYKKL